MSDSEEPLPTEKDILGRIFEMVNRKKEESPKKPRKKRVLSDEAKAKALDNLKRGRETSMRNRQKRANEKKKPPKPEEPKPEKEPKVEKEPEKEPEPPREVKEEPRAVVVPQKKKEEEHKPKAPEKPKPDVAPPSIDIKPHTYRVWDRGGVLW